MNFLITGRYRIENKKPLFYIDDGWDNFFKKKKSKYEMYKSNMKLNCIKNFDCLIISGGGDIYKISKKKFDKYRDNLEIKLIKLFLKNNKPIILVCRGFQLVGNFYNNKLTKINNHIRVNHLINVKKNSLSNKMKIVSNSYHKYGFLELNEKFEIIGRTSDKSIEIAILKKKKILCTMFHPERQNKSQKLINKLITTFLKKSICN